MSEDQSGIYRLLVIDGSENGPDLNGGRTVCINSTGDRPLSEATIDPTGAACGVTFEQIAQTPVVPPPPGQPTISVPPPAPPMPPISPVPEPSIAVLMVVAGAFAVHRARRRQ